MTTDNPHPGPAVPSSPDTGMVEAREPYDPSAVQTELEDNIDRVLFRRVLQGRLVGYTREAAHELASLYHPQPVRPDAVPLTRAEHEAQHGSAGAPSFVPEQLPMPPYRYQDDPSMRGPTGMVAPSAPEASSAPFTGALEFAHKPWPQDYAALRIGLDRAYRDKRSSLYSDASKAIEWLSDRVWELQDAAPTLLAERDEAIQRANKCCDLAYQHQTRAEAVMAELEEAKRALEPVARMADGGDHQLDRTSIPIAFGYLRRARAAFSALSGAKGVGR